MADDGYDEAEKAIADLILALHARMLKILTLVKWP